MLDRVHELPAAWLNPRDYRAEYERDLPSAVDLVYLLERRQILREPEDPSWKAFSSGNWPRAMELIEQDRHRVWAKVQRERDAGVRVRHIRVVEFPIGPHVQWQMHALRLFAKEGRELRVLNSTQVRFWEVHHPLPEVVLLGARQIYELRYDTTDILNSARCIDDPAVVTACQGDLNFLFAQGEDLSDFFDREIAPLPPPERG